MIPDKNKLFSELDVMGEQTVRERLAQGVFHKDKMPLVHEWLRQREEERINAATSRAESAASRADRRARSANLAAWIAAIAAIITIIAEVIHSLK